MSGESAVAVACGFSPGAPRPRYDHAYRCVRFCADRGVRACAYVAQRSLLQMLGKKAEAARPVDICAGLVVTRPLIAMGAVLRARIDVHLDVRHLGADGLGIAYRYDGVLFAVMQLP